MVTVDDQQFFCSWSGGKDSSLALYRAMDRGWTPGFLLTMLDESGERSRSHGLPLALVESQAASIGIQLVTRSASWEGYEEAFTSALVEMKKSGVAMGVFGDIDIDEHRQWVERVCGNAGVQPVMPLWKAERESLTGELLDAGFEATIVVVKDDKLDKGFLGRVLSRDVLAEVHESGVDMSGEGGEYHTIVTNGPLFSAPVPLRARGQVHRDGYWFLDVSTGV
jgi:uncharacterized protein (TIGR00290 family)